MPTQPSYWKVLTRRKILNNETEEGATKLHRVLGLFDLTTLGVGSTLGAGVYVLAGQIAKDQAGPSVMISFAIAALASALAGICYAEFGARVPKAGSAYVYSYVCIGEFVAFVIGWNLILEYVIGTAGVCRGISLYLDTLLNDTLKTCFANIAPMHWNFVGEYFDFFALSLAVIFGVGTAFGVETSTMLNNFCTVLNISVLSFVIIAGSINADISNWQIVPSDNFNSTVYNIGNGGYFPFGIQGTFKGAATCFFGFVGFDCIATTGEEVQNPRKNIPLSIVYSLLIIFLCYFGVSTVLTLMVPYYIQDPNAPLPFAFKEIGWNFAMWTVTIGGLVGLFASLFGALFPIPRIIYSMAEDGLLFRFLGKVSPRFRTPVIGSIFAAFLTGMIAGIFNLAQLVNLLSIGTLLAYTVVAISITILRFMNSDGEMNRSRTDCQLTENSMLTSNDTKITFKQFCLQIFNSNRLSTPTSLSTKIVGLLIIFFCIISLACGLLIMTASGPIMNYEFWALALLSLFIFLIIIVLIVIWLQPQEVRTPTFRVPLVPLVPAISIFINIYLMLQLDFMTWIRFAVWMIIGIPIFIICTCDKSNYGIKNREQLFLEALRNDYTKVRENGVCNTKTSINISVSLTINKENEDKNLSIPNPLLKSKYANARDNMFFEESEFTHSKDILKNEFCNPSRIEHESYVIAILDDILKHEDDNKASPDFIKKKNLGSKITSDCSKITTIAMIHNHATISTKIDDVNQNNNDISYANVWQLAFNLIDEILQSDELMITVESKRKYSNQKQELTTVIDNNYNHHKFSESKSDLSEFSLDENPLYSENFKNKLSLLIIRPPLINNFKLKERKYPTSTEFSQNLTQSKSESEIHKMVLKAIECTAVAENIATSYKEQINIPMPPKFDPVLYKTIGKISKTNIRTRPCIDELIINRSTESAVVELVEDNIQFRTKLETILKRGLQTHTVQK